jgi:hypothetical protein
VKAPSDAERFAVISKGGILTSVADDAEILKTQFGE